MNRKKILLILLIVGLLFIPCNLKSVYADDLSDNIEDQLDNIDLKELDDYLKEMGYLEQPDIKESIKKILEGDYRFDYKTIIEYVLKSSLQYVAKLLPDFISVLIIAVFCSLLKEVKSRFLSDGVDKIISYICMLGIFIIISKEFFSLWNTARNTLYDISDFSEILTPILLSIMIAMGAGVSASIYEPSILFVSGGVIKLITEIIFPLISIIIALGVVSNLVNDNRFNKLTEFVSSIIKWILGLVCSVFGVFISIRGFSGAIHDGISFKAAKYAITSSVPVVGGLLKDGFDLIIAGSILIKNTVGIIGIFALFIILIIPVLKLAVFSILLKFNATTLDLISGNNSFGFLTVFSKSITYIIASLITVGIMFFIMIMMIVLTGNAFL